MPKKRDDGKIFVTSAAKFSPSSVPKTKELKTRGVRSDGRLDAGGEFANFGHGSHKRVGRMECKFEFLEAVFHQPAELTIFQFSS